MPNANQRRGQAFLASQNIQREAQRIAADHGITEEAAVAVVFNDPELLAKCHGVPKAETINPKWVAPNAPDPTVAAQRK